MTESKAEKTKQYIIESSASTFNTKGYASTSISDIVHITGLTKGAIYGNFKNKNEIVIATYKYNVKALEKKLRHIMEDKNSSEAKLIALTDYYRNNWEIIFSKGGCPIQNASIEADDYLIFLKKHIQASIDKWMKKITAIIETGQKNKEFKKNINAEQKAYDILAILEGGLMLSKIMNNHELLFSSLDRITSLVNMELKN